MDDATLTISSKNYSSWSLRGWLMTKFSGLSFRENVISADDPSMRDELLLLSSSFLVPCLNHAGLNVWDTLAIGEYLNEIKPEAASPAEGPNQADALPLDLRGDAFRLQFPALGLAGEFAGRFSELQGVETSSGRYRPHHHDLAGVSRSLRRPFLLGERSMADAMYAPVVTRFLTYHVKLDRYAEAYCRKIMAMPEMIEWIEAAKQEPRQLEELEVEF